ncbi:hypothetical protein M885DRAFT_515537, partial [Pelagophyceae sp. CCMP2097]
PRRSLDGPSVTVALTVALTAAPRRSLGEVPRLPTPRLQPLCDVPWTGPRTVARMITWMVAWMVALMVPRTIAWTAPRTVA